MLLTIFAETEEFKGVKQQLKVFRLSLRQFNIFYRTSLQNNRLPTINTSQVMMIPIYRAIECFTCWKVSTSHQSFLLENTKMSINRSQSHIGRAFDQCAVKLLAAHLISAIVQLIQNLLLTASKARALINHVQSFESQTFHNIIPLVPC